MSSWITFDIDDSIGDWVGAMIATLNEPLGTTFTYNDFKSYKTPEMWDLDWRDWYELMDKLGTYDAVRPYDGVVQAIQRLSDRGINIQYVTARGQVVDKQVTERWLHAHHLPVDDLVITYPGESKTEHYHPNSLWVVEDNIKHLQAAAGSGRSCIRVSHVWNEHVHEPAWHTVKPNELAAALDSLSFRLR